MNKIISILICCFIAGCLFVSCEQPDIPDVPNYDKTEILTFKVYNQDKEEVGTPVILSDEGVVTITVDEGTDLSNVFATCTLFRSYLVSRTRRLSGLERAEQRIYCYLGQWQTFETMDRNFQNQVTA